MRPNALDDLQRFEGHLALLLPGNVVGSERERTDACAEAAFETTLGQVVEQRRFFGDADWIPQRQDIHQRPQANALGALRCFFTRARTLGKTHVEMMFGDEVEIHPRLICELQNVEMIFVELDIGERKDYRASACGQKVRPS